MALLAKWREVMDRRKFLGKSAGVLTAATVGSQLAACNHAPRADQKPWDVHIFLQRLKMLDDQITQKISFFKGDDLKTRQREALFRQSLSTLLFVGSLHDLSESSRRHPEVQNRLKAAMSTFDDTMFRTMTFLENTTKEERKCVQTTLREKKAVAKAFKGHFMKKGIEMGIPTTRLVHLNKILDQTIWQMGKQNPSLLIDPYIKRGDRLARKAGVTPKMRRAKGVMTTTVSSALQPVGADWRDEDKPPRRGVTAGAIILGIGATATAVGITAGAIGGGDAFILGGLFGWTPGAVLIVVGLILLAVGN